MFSLNNLKLTELFTLIIVVFSIGFAVYGAWSYSTLNDLKINGKLYQQIIQNKNLVADVLPPPEYIIESYLTVLELKNENDQTKQDTLIEKLNSLKKQFETRHLYWSKAHLDDNLSQTLLKQSFEPANQFYNITQNRFIPAIKKNDRAAVDSSLVEISGTYQAHREAIDEVTKIANKKTSIIEASARTQIQYRTILMLIILAISMIAGIAIARIAKDNLLDKLGADPKDLSAATMKIAEGELDQVLPVIKNDKTSMYYQIDQMRQQLRKIIDLEKSEERTRTHQATLFAAHHYFNNALNHFQLVLMEVEDNKRINPDSLQKVKDSIFKASDAMREFGELKNPTHENVTQFIKERLE